MTKDPMQADLLLLLHKTKRIISAASGILKTAVTSG